MSISIKPPIIKSAAVNFQLKTLTCLITRSTIAFKGIPSKVPIEMKRGKVYAIPKLMLKLKTTLRAELIQMYSQGTLDIFSIFSRCRISGIGQRKRVLKIPSEERKRAIWYRDASPTRHFKRT